MAYDTNVYLPPRQGNAVTPSAPLGFGAHVFYMDGARADEVQLYRTATLDGTKLSDLTTLRYSSFVEAGASGDPLVQPAYLRLTLDTDNDGIADSSLFYEPAYQGDVVNGSWQDWDATVSTAIWSTTGLYADADQTSLADYINQHPDATIVESADAANAPTGQGVGGLSIVVGDGSAGLQAGRYLAVDQVVVNGTTYDFEPNASSWGAMAYETTEYLQVRQGEAYDGSAPSGVGARFFYMDGAQPDEVQLYRSTVLDGQTLSTVSGLQYSTFVEDTGSLKQPAYLRLSLDNTDDGSADASLFFQPAYQGQAVTNGVWQPWDATQPGSKWSTDGSYAGTDVVTWQEIQDLYGTWTVVPSGDPAAPAGSGVGGLALIVGDGSGGLQADADFGVDAMVVNGTTYDFEPVLTGTGGGGTDGGGGTTTPPVPPTAPEGTTNPEGASSSDPEGTATASSGETTVTATGVGAFTVAQYTANPTADSAPLETGGTFFDVLAAEGSDFASLTIEQCGLTDDTHSIVWFNGTRWLKASDVVYRDGCASVTITDTSTPSLSDLTGTVFAAGSLPVQRLAGDDRFGTAIAVSQDRFPAANSADAVVLARSNAYPDALAGAPLAAAKNAPVLLTKPDTLRQDTGSEIDRVLDAGDTIYVLGGTGAVSEDVVNDLREAGYQIERIGGENRYQTAVAIAEALGNPGVVLEVPGTGYADAIAAGPAAAKLDAAILLTKGVKQSPATADYLSEHPNATRYAIGGLSARADSEAEAIAGEDRTETALAVAREFFPEPMQLSLATGRAFPDALAVGPIEDAPVVLVPGQRTVLPTVVQSYLDTVDSTVLRLRVLGGEGAVLDTLSDTAGNLLQ